MMRLTDQGLMLGSLLLVSLCVVAAAMFDNEQLDDHWDQWKKTHEKTYQNEVEENHRRKLWEKKLMLITKHNLEASMGLHTYELGMNSMGDMTPEEIQQFSGKLIPPTDLKREPLPPLNSDAPRTFDWRDKGRVTRVKNEGSCKCGYAFAAVGAMEAHVAKTQGRLEALSPQQLVDCSNGCNGGSVPTAFDYIIRHGIESEASYPYQGRVGRCKHDDNHSRAKLRRYEGGNHLHEETLKQHLYEIGPIAVMIDANHDKFIHYKSGIYDNPRCTQDLNRSVLIVGYGTQDGKDYWVVKNSWGTGWGEGGYIRMVRNKNNQCGIALYPSYPTK